MRKLIQLVAASTAIIFFSGCAFAPGMRVGDLPASGSIVTSSGQHVQVEMISTQNIPETQPKTVLAEVLPLFDQQSYPTYTLASGDVLGIYLWANPELTAGVAVPLSGANAAGTTNVVPTAPVAGFAIDQEGYLTFPLINRIYAKGESVESFRLKLQKQLAVYLKQSDAQVRVLAYGGHKYFVDGDVRLPGQYALTDQPQTLYSALANAGGALATGDINNIVLTRNGKNYHISMLDLQLSKLSPNNLFLHDGDSIHVYAKENRKLYVLGEAGVPTPLLIPEQGMSLSGAIGEGRGPNPLSSNVSRIYVVRDDAGNNLTKVYHLDLSSLANIALAERFKMQANDVVYVDASGLARWSRVLNLLLPSAQSLAALSTAQYNSNHP